MTSAGIPLLARLLVLLAAHVVGDYLLQACLTATKSDNVWALLQHAAIYAGTVTLVDYLLVSRSSSSFFFLLVLLLVLFVSHAVIDSQTFRALLYQRLESQIARKAIDQAAHILVLLALTLI